MLLESPNGDPELMSMFFCQRERFLYRLDVCGGLNGFCVICEEMATTVCSAATVEDKHGAVKRGIGSG